MFGEYNTALEAYEQNWQKLVAGRRNKKFFGGLKPTSMGWKVADLQEFNERFMVLRDQSDQVHLCWMNERWLATFHLKNQSLAGGIVLVKLMQRRPGSTDAVGLDHLDYFIPADVDVKETLAAEPDLQWTEERNGEHCKWLSVWFEGTEAKLRRDTVLEVCANELMECHAAITTELKRVTA